MTIEQSVPVTAAEDAEVEALVDAMHSRRQQEWDAAAQPGGYADRSAEREHDPDRWVAEADQFNWAHAGRQR